MAKLIIFLLFLTTYFCISHGCTVVGANWPLPVSGSVVDTYRGVILDMATTGIDGIESVNYGAAINNRQYVDFNIINSRLVISTNPRFDEYEENETALQMQIAVIFRCSDGSSPITYNFFINVVDTNNNAPQFRNSAEGQPRDEFEFTVTAPLPPGFEITGCLNDLIVRDIDLTTSRIDFAIEDNEYFEIDYGGLTVPKEFQGILRTKTLIRSIPEPITLTISATDVDATGDDPITTKGKITIIGDREFEMPEEPVFTKAFYLADYTEDNRVVLEETISLRSGYHSDVDFSIEGEFKNNFEIVTNPQYENQMSIGVTIPLTGDVLDQPNILLAVKAKREHTSGASATVIVRLPQGIPLEFERAHYEGTIENNILDVPPLILTQGYEGTVVSANVISDYTSNFNAIVQGNTITLSMTPLEESIINENSFIYLQIVASADRSITTTVVTLEIIKDDNITPVFNQPIYTGSYNPGADLSIEQISFTQGYDGIDSLEFFGDNSNYFTATQVGASVRITVSTIPPALYSLGHIVLSLEATKPRTVGASATLIINLPGARELGFESSTYRGSLQNNVLTLDPIPLTLGYDENIDFSITGDYASNFRVSKEENRAIIRLETPIPNDVILENNIVMLTLAASGLNAVTTTTSVILDIIKDDTTTPVFSRNIYYGTYLGSNINIEDIILTQGYDSSVTFRLDGDHAQYFDVSNTGNRVEIVQLSPIPEDVIHNEKVLVFNVLALKALTVGANAAVSISFPSELTDPVVMRFAQNTYTATIDNNGLTADHIVLSTGYAPGTEFVHTGDYSSYFSIKPNENRVTLSLLNPLPTDVIPNSFVVLEIEATRERAVSASTSIVVDIIQEEIVPPKFTQPYYRGVYDPESGLQFNEVISLLYGHDDTVDFHLDGEFSSLFRLVELDSKSRSIEVLTPISEEVLKDNSHLLFTVVATKPGSYTARATISVDIVKESPQGTLEFDRVTYLGTIQNDVAHVGPITIIQGFTDDVTLALYGDLAVYFTTRREASVVTVTMVMPIPTELIPDNRIIVLEIRASSLQANTAYATIVLEAIFENDTPPTIQLAFDAPFYTGSYNTIDGLRLDTSIALAGGHDANTQFGLQGENSQWFSVSPGSNSVTIVVSSAIPEAVLASNRKFVFLITAQRPGALSAQATIVISLNDGSSNGNVAEFENIFYEGVIQGNDVRHELVRIFGYDGTTVDVIGDYSSLFMARASDGVVTVGASGTLNLPDDVTRVVLELQAAGARTAMVLNVEQSDAPILPTVTFSSEIYEVTVGIAQTGLIGRVSATTNNGEAVTYSLGTVNAHLQTRLSINNEGELHLSAPANSGVYTFQVVATSVITQASGTATVTLAVEAVTVCEDGEIVVPPLIIIDRDEEQAHRNLVVLDPEQRSGCHYTMTHRWPTNANWLYVDENGLHANVIDREHPSIAFMALSQVQVELILHCENDNPGRSKRSERTDWLGPYDYGSNKWILTDTILYNSRRSLVNLIVNDINDNDPIFVGKEHEPIVVGYPTDDLEERILPRSLVELKATDADVGENAQLMYSSAESSLAVAPTTGFVHVRSGATLEQDQILTVRATDQNGNGRTGTIQLMVKLLDLGHIAVVTVRDAFLDDETTVLNQLSAAVGYEVKALRSVVISDDIDGDVTRKTREANNGGASLQLFVYGLIAREPVVVERLTTDISTNAANVNVISTLTLEDHLEDINIFERDIGLLVATIVLSVLLFMLIVLIAIWFFLRWRKSKKYNELSEENSLASRNSSLGEVPKPEPMKPRLNIEDLKRSEKRLQERLEAPIEEISVEPMSSRKLESPVEAILDMPVPEVSPPIPIVIQSIDKLKDADDDDDTDDEFGEVTAPRKSVVTFNENVEKIITVEDDAEDDGDSSQAGYEVYRL